MATPTPSLPETFIIDCPDCRAKVAALQFNFAERFTSDSASQPCGKRVYTGECPRCSLIVVGESNLIEFENIDVDEDRWSDIVRVYPRPAKTFSSWRIPKVIIDSLSEADKSMQAGANIAACAMLGRALEALCRHTLAPSPNAQAETEKKPQKEIMLGEGIKKMHEAKIIDNRLYDWSQQLHISRNLAAHPEDITISRTDAEDLQSFVNAIVEYVYDLTDRYEDFKERADKRDALRKA